MQRKILAFSLLLLVLLFAAFPAAAATEVYVPSDVSGPMWWDFSTDNPTVIVLLPHNLVPAPNASDNLRIGLITQVKEAGGVYEVLTVRFKINGRLAIGSPRYGIADQEVGNWTNDVPVYVYIYENKIEVKVNGETIWSYTASEDVPINYIYSDSATYGVPAFDGGGYVKVYIDQNALLSLQMQENTEAMVQLMVAFIPLIGMMFMLGLMGSFFDKLARIFK